jgi:hypothetical protein
MSHSRSASFRAIAALLITYLLFFAFLSMDVIVRLWMTRGQFDRITDVAVLMMLEFARTAAILSITWQCVRLSKVAIRPATRSLTLGLLALGIWFAKAFAFASYPGFAQEWLAARLIEWHTPIWLLRVVFGEPEWAAWLALGAFLRTSVTWPRRLRSSSIAGSGTNDRTGMMRSVAFAGADVGEGFRRLAAKLVAVRAFRPSITWPVVIAAGAISVPAMPMSVKLGCAALFGLGVALVITNARAAQNAAGIVTRWRALWVAQAGLTAIVAFLLTGLLSLRHDAGTVMLSFAVSALAPFAVLMAISSGTLTRHVPDPKPAIRRTLSTGAAAVVGIVAWLIIQLALTPANGVLPVSQLVGIAAAITTVVATRGSLRRFADQFVRRTDPA